MAAIVEYTHPDVYTRGVDEGWAEAETDPTRIDWTDRQARAAIPYQVINRRPVRPGESTGIHRGRNELGHWGEQLCADAIVTATEDDHRWLLMIERADGHGWATPGGYVDQGEAADRAAVRELREETGLDLTEAEWTSLPARIVPDPRGSDESWMVTVPACTTLDRRRNVTGADDARRAAWIPADTYATLTEHLATLDGQVFPAHVAMIAEALDRARLLAGHDA